MDRLEIEKRKRWIIRIKVYARLFLPDQRIVVT